MYKYLKDKEGAVIVDGTSKFIPSKTKSFFPQNPWFDRAYSLAIQARDSACRVWKNSRSTITLANFHSARNSCRDTLRRAKLAFIKGKCANLLGFPTDKSFISSNFCKSAFPPLIRSDHCVANSPTKKANLFGPSLNYIFYVSILALFLPQCWKLSHVQPIPKKGSRSDPSNYRPVALTCILSKIFETLLNSLLRSSGNSLRSPVRLSLHEVYWRYTFLFNRFMVFRS